jgi:hypothetical protein
MPTAEKLLCDGGEISIFRTRHRADSNIVKTSSENSPNEDVAALHDYTSYPVEVGTVDMYTVRAITSIIIRGQGRGLANGRGG